MRLLRVWVSCRRLSWKELSGSEKQQAAVSFQERDSSKSGSSVQGEGEEEEGEDGAEAVSAAGASTPWERFGARYFTGALKTNKGQGKERTVRIQVEVICHCCESIQRWPNFTFAALDFTAVSYSCTYFSLFPPMCRLWQTESAMLKPSFEVSLKRQKKRVQARIRGVACSCGVGDMSSVFEANQPVGWVHCQMLRTV